MTGRVGGYTETAFEESTDGKPGPAYLRGKAYLMLYDGSQPAADFQKVLDHRSFVLNRFQKRTLSAAAYQDFLTLWKDADPDIPILIAAKAEYAELQ